MFRSRLRSSGAVLQATIPRTSPGLSPKRWIVSAICQRPCALPSKGAIRWRRTCDGTKQEEPRSIPHDARFLNIARHGETLAPPELGHSVHVDLTGLDRWYYYRFIAGGEASPIGRTRTFSPIGSSADRLRFAFASCQHYGQGYSPPMRRWPGTPSRSPGTTMRSRTTTRPNTPKTRLRSRSS
jgi:PhoD-like phosphatase, N-terminal domain